MDVGGGNGLLLATILKAHPALRGVLVDRPHVLARAQWRDFWSPDAADRVRFEPADCFQGVPSECRAYPMRNVIHDWDDEPARLILVNCRQGVRRWRLATGGVLPWRRQHTHAGQDNR